ncbi:MAG: SsrA-binding protein SmpB [Sulfurimonas sp.]|jgi:SsrA-binding protein|nr:SsrA-binding protein SmpB [Sulfurimonadaceae bacterium]
MKIIAKNKKALFDYFILDRYEAGLVLKGSEVKALRDGRVNLKDSFVRFVKNEAFIFGMHIGKLETTHHFYSHEERATRKLLLHRKEIDKMIKEVERDGHTVVPLEIYFDDKNRAKLTIAVAKGKQLHDKREDLKQKDMKRDIERMMKG